MRKVEVLSPAGDLDSFYRAIESGADAVYLGLNKFNARMKADNFSVENLQNVVDFAHLKGVRVYITLNTLISNGEMQNLVNLVGFAINCGVDAFIVQDYGIIFALKKLFPDIVLHGSTQLGVHNRRGAMVAKRLGLKRVVLSREATINDILDISKNVDIELEVFVQGANCVCFSGNCYLSSLKFGASGNRGECKQLCRLPYTLSDGKISKKGFMISPRDNCMLPVLEQLISAGVMSLKIEGRLRRSGYVAVATSVYRKCVDSILNSGVLSQTDTDLSIQKLKSVFSRGEFVQGYNNGKDIIEPRFNSHMGNIIGSVVKCTKFKDIYKIELCINAKLSTNDGLKIVSPDGSFVSLGVGNIEYCGKNTIVFAKNHVNAGDIVYRTVDSVLENATEDLSKYRNLDISVSLKVGKKIALALISGNHKATIEGEVCSPARTKSLSSDDVSRQVCKLAEFKQFFKISSCNVDIDESVFLPLGAINSIRATALQKLTQEILNSSKISAEVNLNNISSKLKNLLPSMTTPTFNSLAIVDETFDISTLVGVYDALILSPSVYRNDIVLKFYKNYSNVFSAPLILNLPNICLLQDLKIIDEIVNSLSGKNVILLCNNIYGLDYCDKLPLFAGSNLNITNDYAISGLLKLGIKEFVGSIENWSNISSSVYRMCRGSRVLMTMAHCPVITLYGGKCPKDTSNLTQCSDKLSCKYTSNLMLLRADCNYKIRRFVICDCYFELLDSVKKISECKHKIDDLRG